MRNCSKSLARFRQSRSITRSTAQHIRTLQYPLPWHSSIKYRSILPSICEEGSTPCELAILYPDRIEILNWTTLARRIKSIPAEFFAPVRSRAPSGKILKNGEHYLVLNSNLSAPLQYDLKFNGPLSDQAPLPILPTVASGLNYYTLGDGRFFDFEPLESGGMAVIETGRRLSVAAHGEISTSSQQAGASLAVHWPTLYTSAPVPPGQPDSVQKFTLDGQTLLLASSRPADGDIIDLAVTDLNRDEAAELLVTVRKPEGVFVEVWEIF